jgi:hypothetical protein
MVGVGGYSPLHRVVMVVMGDLLIFLKRGIMGRNWSFLSNQLSFKARLPPLRRGAFTLPFPPSIQFELCGLVNWVILLLGLCYKVLGLSPVQYDYAHFVIYYGIFGYEVLYDY